MSAWAAENPLHDEPDSFYCKLGPCFVSRCNAHSGSDNDVGGAGSDSSSATTISFALQGRPATVSAKLGFPSRAEPPEIRGIKDSDPHSCYDA
jgi:hypothetical protein